MRGFFTIVLLFPVLIFAQEVQNLKSNNSALDFENIYSLPIYENEHASYYLISIKKEVKSHKHLHHTESITVVEGIGIMTIGDKSFEIGEGDFFTIPKNTFHAVEVKSKTPLKVISIQMPKFDPADRIFEEE